ncbi:MAG: GTP-binding protein [Bacteroidales bacterium]
MKTSPIPLYLISGFLGSGKSCFLRNILEKLGDDRRIGIVQNEFSSINIDSRILKESKKPYAIMEVNRGSVFCLCLLNDFIPSLSRFIDDEQPDVLFIEASGLSDPVAILQMVHSPHLSHKVRFTKAYTIVDGYLFEKQVRMLKSVSNQIRIADCVLINKCDKLEPKDTITIASQIKEYNPFCNILNTEYSTLPVSEIEIVSSGSGTALALSHLAADECRPLSFPPDVRVETISTAKKIPRENFDRLAQIIKPLLRVKGFLRATDGSNWTIQSVSGDISFREYSHNLLRSEMVLFGEEIEINYINKLFLP